MDIGFGDAVLIFGGLLTVVAALSGVMKGTVLSASVLSVALGILLAAVGVVDIDPPIGVDRRAGRAGADPHPLLRRDVRRARVAAQALEPGGAGAGDRDADHDGAARPGGKGALSRAELGGGAAAGGGALADRSRRHLRRRHLADRAGVGASHAQPRVRPQRRSRPARSSSSSSFSPAPVETRAAKRRSWSARRSSAPPSASASARSAAACTTTCPAAASPLATRASTRSALPSLPLASPT